MKLSVIVPFYNELRTLPTVIDRLLAVDFASLGLETELVFVDDGSTDVSRSLLDPAPRDDVRLIVHERNLGKGAAVRTGLEAATGDVLCIQDADLEYDPADLPSLLQPIVDGAYEVVYGNRFKGSAAGLYFSHRVANRLLNLMVNVAFNRYLSDVYTGYKVFTRQAFEGLSLTARTFTVEMELTAHFLRKGLVIFEVPISYRARTYAEGKKIHFRDGFLAAGALLRYRFQRRPGGVLGPASRRAPDPLRDGPDLPARARGPLRLAGRHRDRRGAPGRSQDRPAGGHRGRAQRARPHAGRRRGAALDGERGRAPRHAVAAGARLPAARRRVRPGARPHAPLHAGDAEPGGHHRGPGARGDPPGEPARRHRLVGRGPHGPAGPPHPGPGEPLRQAGRPGRARHRAPTPALVRPVGPLRRPRARPAGRLT